MTITAPTTPTVLRDASEGSPGGARLSPAPGWVAWAALVWAGGYGVVRVWFATGHAPAWEVPSDLLVPGWVSVAGCVASAAAVVTLMNRPRSRVAIGATSALAGGWVVSCALILLDLIGGLLPGLGIPFDVAGLMSRLGGLTGALLLAGTALAKQRQLNPECLRCIGLPKPLTTPRWAIVAGWVAIGGCVVRLAAQAAVGLDTTPYRTGLSMVVFEGGFLLAGTALPLLLVTRFGRIFPRWMLLLPGAGLGAGITAYFGVGLVQMIIDGIQGEAVYSGTPLPTSFFWIAIPAYLIWGAGLAVAATDYYLHTRNPCKGCGREATPANQV